MKKIPKPLKNIGLWIDHSEARLILPGKDASVLNIIPSGLQTHVRTAGQTSDVVEVGNFYSTNHEYSKHKQENGQAKAYFKKLSETLLPYDEILIFGPTTAGEELHNFLVKEKKFTGKIIHLKHTDYQTDKQVLAFVKKNLE